MSAQYAAMSASVRYETCRWPYEVNRALIALRDHVECQRVLRGNEVATGTISDAITRDLVVGAIPEISVFGWTTRRL